MKATFAIAIGSALILGATAQQQQAPPPITAPPPPSSPSVAPATPQPGVPTGATGRSALPEPSSGIRRPTNGLGVSTPFPVIVPPNTFPQYPEAFDPLAFLEMLETIQSTPQPPTYGGTAQGRPGGGLGVTITGGSASPPPVTAPPPAPTPAVTNVPAATNISVPTNSGGTTVTNATPGSLNNRTYP